MMKIEGFKKSTGFAIDSIRYWDRDYDSFISNPLKICSKRAYRDLITINPYVYFISTYILTDNLKYKGYRVKE